MGPLELSAISYQLSAISYQLSAISYQSLVGETEAAELRRIPAPFGQHLNVGLQVHAAPQQLLDPLARVFAECFERVPTRADQDAFLRLALDEERRPNVHGIGGFPELLDLGGERIGQLVLEQLEGGLPQVFDGEEKDRLGAALVGGGG